MGPDAEALLSHVHDPELLERLKTSDVVLLPRSLRPDAEYGHFAPGTRDFYRYARDNLPCGLSVEVAASDDGYLELGLHGDELWLPTVLFFAFAPHTVNVLLGVLSNYVYDRLRGVLTSDVRVHAKVYINQRQGTVSIDYDGPAATFADTMKTAMKGASSNAGDDQST